MHLIGHQGHHQQLIPITPAPHSIVLHCRLQWHTHNRASTARFWFFGPNPLPLRISLNMCPNRCYLIIPPHQQPPLSHPITICDGVPETEPPLLGFGFFGPNPAPARFTERAPQPLQSHHLQHPSTCLHCIPSPFVMARLKLSLCRSVSVFRPQTPASGVSPDEHPNHRDLVIPSTSEPPCIAFHRCLRWCTQN